LEVDIDFHGVSAIGNGLIKFWLQILSFEAAFVRSAIMEL